MRLALLQRQAKMVSELRADLGLEWANELFTLSSHAAGGERSYSQDSAITILARLDPSRALELLLLAAASALQMGRRLPLSSRPEQNAGKPSQ